MNKECNDGDGAGHHQREAVIVDGEVRMKAAGLNPGEVAMDKGSRIRSEMCADGRSDGEYGCQSRCPAADDRHETVRETAAEDAVYGGPNERGQEHEKEKYFHNLTKPKGK